MSGRAPLGAHLREAFSDSEVEAMWREVASRRARRIEARWIPVTLVATAALALAALSLRHPKAIDQVAPPANAPLRLASRSALSAEALENPGPAQRAVRFDDASTVTLGPSTSLRPIANEGARVTFAMSAGRAAFEVTPKGPRRWRVECGLATVTVVGTSFEIERSPRALRVQVSHGTVWVDGAAVPEGHRVLRAGQSLALQAPPAPLPSPAPSPSPALTAPARRSARLAPQTPAPSVWRERAREGDAQGAWESLGDRGFQREAEVAGPTTLLELADIARRARHHDQAAPLLERFIREHPDHPEAAMAAFTLGRDELSRRHRPAQAASCFERALALRPPLSLSEDLHARLVEARRASGDEAGACDAARRYLARFSNGRYAARMRAGCERP